MKLDRMFVMLEEGKTVIITRDLALLQKMYNSMDERYRNYKMNVTLNDNHIIIKPTAVFERH
ncbi:MAG: hypothetical protein JJU28_12305 [Cyclobacteriaceae bacterium]|nr:hypothetical protein [Cyclobacteriaceae bacterium]